MNSNQQTEDRQAIARVRNLLRFYEDNHEVIFGIVNLVQKNQDFFDIKCGDDCLEYALKKLERLVEEKSVGKMH